MITTAIQDNPQLVQYGAYVRIDGDSNYPPTSVYRTRYPDASLAYNNQGVPPISAFEVDIYPKFAQLVYSLNPTTITLSGASITSSSTVAISTFNTAPTEAMFLPGSTTITALTGTGFFQKMWIYPISGFSGGVPAFNSGNVYIGKSGGASTKYLPDVLTPSGGPLSIILPVGQQMSLNQVIIKLTVATDGIFYNWT